MLIPCDEVNILNTFRVYAIVCYYLLSYAVVFVFIYVIVILQIRYISLIIISGQIIIYNINMCILMYTETSPMT